MLGFGSDWPLEMFVTCCGVLGPLHALSAMLLSKLMSCDFQTFLALYTLSDQSAAKAMNNIPALLNHLDANREALISMRQHLQCHCICN